MTEQKGGEPGGAASAKRAPRRGIDVVPAPTHHAYDESSAWPAIG
jgi:hypothetical protein